MGVPTLSDIDVSGKRVVLRCSFDLPLDASKDLLDPQRVKDDTRIKSVLPTIQHLLDNNAKIVLAAGWSGRPKGEDPDFSLAPVAKKLEQLLKEKNPDSLPVLLAPNCFEDKKPRSVYQHKDEVKSMVDALQESQIVMLENVRYDPEANGNDEAFAEFIASLGDVYVNDAEAQNHRPEATVVTTPLLMAKRGCPVVFGFKYAEVLENIGGLLSKLDDPNRGPFVFGLCGKKIETTPGIRSKISVALALIEKMKKGDTIIVGGAVVYTFLLAEQYSEAMAKHRIEIADIDIKYNRLIDEKTKTATNKKEAAALVEEVQKQKSTELKTLLAITDDDLKKLIGGSYIRWGQEGEQIVFAHQLTQKAQIKDINVITAVDHTIADKYPDKFGLLPDDTNVTIHDEPTGIPHGYLGVGEGPETLVKISSAIENAAMYLQSGPYSIEDPKVEQESRTDDIIFTAARLCKARGGITLGAGGDTTARINERQAHESFSVISSAGGATLELLETGTSKGKDAVMQSQEILKS